MDAHADDLAQSAPLRRVLAQVPEKTSKAPAAERAAILKLRTSLPQNSVG